MNELIQLLHKGDHTLVVENNGHRVTFTGRGVRDLYTTLTDHPALLRGARAADKVVGKAAAALFLLGKVRELHADVISKPALELLTGSFIAVSYDQVVPHIINRTGTGWCPLESRCIDLHTPEECFSQISTFIKSQIKTH